MFLRHLYVKQRSVKSAARETVTPEFVCIAGVTAVASSQVWSYWSLVWWCSYTSTVDPYSSSLHSQVSDTNMEDSAFSYSAVKSQIMSFEIFTVVHLRYLFFWNLPTCSAVRTLYSTSNLWIINSSLFKK
jgi:hypothetical protein